MEKLEYLLQNKEIHNPQYRHLIIFAAQNQIHHLVMLNGDQMQLNLK